MSLHTTQPGTSPVVHFGCRQSNSPHHRCLPWTHAFVVTFRFSLPFPASSPACSQVRRAFDGALGQDGPDNSQSTGKRFWDSVPVRVRAGCGNGNRAWEGRVGERRRAHRGAAIQTCVTAAAAAATADFQSRVPRAALAAHRQQLRCTLSYPRALRLHCPPADEYNRPRPPPPESTTRQRSRKKSRSRRRQRNRPSLISERDFERGETTIINLHPIVVCFSLVLRACVS